MKFTDRYFRFPIRLYLTKDIEKKDDLSERLGINLPDDDGEDIPHVVGWETVLIENIEGYSTLFSRGMNIEDVEREGFDCTLVSLRNGREVGCSWPPDEFVRKLNEHADYLDELQRGEFKEDAEQVAKEIRLQIEKIRFPDPWYKRLWRRVFK